MTTHPLETVVLIGREGDFVQAQRHYSRIASRKRTNFENQRERARKLMQNSGQNLDILEETF